MSSAQKRKDRRVSMTPAWCERVKAEANPVEWRDTRQPGLVLRVERSGKRTWVARYWFEERDGRFVIGRFPQTTLKAARTRARKIVGLAEDGHDPQAEKTKRRTGGTVAVAVQSWQADRKLGPAAKWKGGLSGGSARSFLPHVRAFERELGTKRLAELTPKACDAFVTKPEAGATRNRRLTALRLFFSWAVRKGLVEADPTAKLGKERERERKRVLSDDELRALVHGFDSSRLGRAVRLLCYTGLRRDEVLSAEWSWCDLDAGVMTIPSEAEKTGEARGEARRVALSPQAVELLQAQRASQLAEGSRGAFVFGTKAGGRPHRDALKPIMYTLKGKRQNGQPPSTHKLGKVRAAQISEDVTIHDVRRTVGHRLLTDVKAAPWVIDHVVMGHVRPKVLRTYQPELPLDEARGALARWAELLDGILAAGKAAKGAPSA